MNNKVLHDPTDIGLSVGRMVTDYRTRNGLSRESFAKKCKVAQGTVANVEWGLPMSVSVLDRLLTGMGVSWVDMGRAIEQAREK